MRGGRRGRAPAVAVKSEFALRFIRFFSCGVRGRTGERCGCPAAAGCGGSGSAALDGIIIPIIPPIRAGEAVGEPPCGDGAKAPPGDSSLLKTAAGVALLAAGPAWPPSLAASRFFRWGDWGGLDANVVAFAAARHGDIGTGLLWALAATMFLMFAAASKCGGGAGEAAAAAAGGALPWPGSSALSGPAAGSVEGRAGFPMALDSSWMTWP